MMEEFDERSELEVTERLADLQADRLEARIAELQADLEAEWRHLVTLVEKNKRLENAAACNTEMLATLTKYGVALERIAKYPSAESWECKPLTVIAREALGLPLTDSPQADGEGKL